MQQMKSKEKVAKQNKRENVNMRGYWLFRSDAMYATGLTPHRWNTAETKLDRRMVKNRRQVFVPEDMCTEQFKAKNIPVEYDDEQDQILEQLQDNVDFNEDADLDSLNKELKKARREKIIKETKLIEERLDERKKELFYDWSQRFFQSFADHFGKLKNNIVELHLNEEQVAKFNQILDNCLNNMQLNLDEIWNDFKDQKQEEIEQ